MGNIICLLNLSLCIATPVSAHDLVLRDDQGQAVWEVSYPADWKQVVGKNYVVATSEEGAAWSVINTLADIREQAAGIQKIKTGLEDDLKEIQYDEPTETERGSLFLSGTGKREQSGVDVDFTSAAFLSGKRHCGVVFIVDADIEMYYEKTELAICESILREENFAEAASDGNAADNVSLYSRPWLAEEIGGRGVVDKAQTTTRFSEDVSVSGDTSVNCYQDRATTDAGKLSSSLLATMDQESTFLKAVEAVNSFRIEATGLLSRLKDAGKTVLRLSPERHFLRGSTNFKRCLADWLIFAVGLRGSSLQLKRLHDQSCLPSIRVLS